MQFQGSLRSLNRDFLLHSPSRQLRLLSVRTTSYIDQWFVFYRSSLYNTFKGSIVSDISPHAQLFFVVEYWRFGSIVKPESFYEEHAESSPRRYFYNVDLQGRLFLGWSAIS